MSTKQFTRALKPFNKVEALVGLILEADQAFNAPGAPPWVGQERASSIARFLLAKERKNLMKSIFYAGR